MRLNHAETRKLVPKNLTAGRAAQLLRQHLAELAVALEIPLAAHGLAAIGEAFDMQHDPKPPAGRARAGAGIMAREPLIEVDGPADIGPIAAFPHAAEDIDAARPASRLASASLCRARIGHAPILASGNGKPVNDLPGERSARVDHTGRKARLVRRIRKPLRLQANSVAAAVNAAALPDVARHFASEIVSRIELQARLGGPDLEHAAGGGIREPCGEAQLAGASFVEHEIVVVTVA